MPLLIHLINMMRHQRVQWAAMEFLLASYKKHRKWIWLKQLLLLLARIAVVVLVVAMLAQLKTRDQWLAIFGGRATILGTVFGCFIIGMIEAGLVASGKTGAWVRTVQGLVFLIAIILYLFVDEPGRRKAFLARFGRRDDEASV